MPVHTVDTLRAGRRRLEARVGRIDQAKQILDEMRNGAVLHLQHAKSGPRWVLSTGRQVTDDIAKLVVASASVVGVGDALFGECQAQTYRWWQETE